MIRHFAVDWFYNDDLATLRGFADAEKGTKIDPERLGRYADLFRSLAP